MTGGPGRARRLPTALLGTALALWGPGGLGAEEGAAGPGRQDGAGGPLVFTVHPSGPEGETLDQRLARRERGFRFICVGCARADGKGDGAPFRPIEMLNAPQLNAALAGEP